jgi:hypothetical protein
MIDPISTQAATGAVGGAGGVGQAGLAEPSGLGGPGQANQKDAAQFAEAMQQGIDPGAQAGQTPGVNTDANVLEGLDKMSADMRAAQQNIVESTSGMGDMGNLIRTQFEVAQLTTTQTMVGQVGQKTSQGTQQLLKGQ